MVSCGTYSGVPGNGRSPSCGSCQLASRRPRLTRCGVHDRDGAGAVLLVNTYRRNARRRSTGNTASTSWASALHRRHQLANAATTAAPRNSRFISSTSSASSAQSCDHGLLQTSSTPSPAKGEPVHPATPRRPSPSKRCRSPRCGRVTSPRKVTGFPQSPSAASTQFARISKVSLRSTRRGRARTCPPPPGKPASTPIARDAETDERSDERQCYQRQRGASWQPDHCERQSHDQYDDESEALQHAQGARCIPPSVLHEEACGQRQAASDSQHHRQLARAVAGCDRRHRHSVGGDSVRNVAAHR